MHWNIENRTKIVERISFKMTFKRIMLQYNTTDLSYFMVCR